jgi:hypothetical protein
MFTMIRYLLCAVDIFAFWTNAYSAMNGPSPGPNGSCNMDSRCRGGPTEGCAEMYCAAVGYGCKAIGYKSADCIGIRDAYDQLRCQGAPPECGGGGLPRKSLPIKPPLATPRPELRP